MLNFMQTAVDAQVVTVAGGTYIAENRLRINDATYNLVGLTVTATIRQLGMPLVILGSGSYEDLPVTLGNDEYTAAEGGVQFTFTIEIADFPVPTGVLDFNKYFIQYHVVEDNYYPQILVFGVRRNTP